MRCLYTRLSPCKLFNACLCRCFSLTQFCLDEFCFMSLDFCNTLLWLRMWHILVKTVWKSRHWHLGISIDTAKFYVFLTKLRGKKQKHFWLIQILCSFIWHQWHVPTIISPEVSIGGLVKKVWIFGALIHLHLEKIVAKKVLGNVPVKHPISSPKFKHICRPFRRVKDDSPQEVHVRFIHAK